jgi:predicted DNA-binding protein YlxM (UPF0122 family)
VLVVSQNSGQSFEKQSSPAIAISLMIDQIPEIKNYLDPYLKSYYEQALPMTERDVQQNIKRFVERYELDMAEIDCKIADNANQVRDCFIKWVKMILTADCRDVRRKKSPRMVSIYEQIKSSKDGPFLKVEDFISDRTAEGLPKLSGLEKWLQENQRANQIKIAPKIREYIEIDPDEKLRRCHPRNKPDCNCQVLLKLFLLEEETVTAIAKKLNVSRATIQPYLEKIIKKEESSEKCLKLLREFIQETYTIDHSQLLNEEILHE